jgi:isoamylase
VFARRRFFEGRPIFGSKMSDSDIGWFRPDGQEMETDDWETGFAKSLGVFLNGDALPDPDRRGRRLSDDSFVLLFNAHDGEVPFVLPGGAWGQLWVADIDSACFPSKHEVYVAGAKVTVGPRSVLVLRRA